MKIKNLTKIILPVTASLTFLAVTADTLTAQAPRGTSERAPDEVLSRQARDFRLDGPEVYPVTRRSINLVAADFNGDGMLDFATISNEKGVLELYLQREDQADGENPFELQEISLDRLIRSFVAIDVNGNGRDDILMTASPARVVVMYQNDNGGLDPIIETDLEADVLLTGDINGNGRDDVLLYREGQFQILESTSRGINLEPSQTFFTAGEPASPPKLIDFDGDGLTDIIYHDSQNRENLVIKLQSPDGSFTSEFRLSQGALRRTRPLHFLGAPGEVLAVQDKTRDIIRLRLTEPSGDTVVASALPLSERHDIAFNPETRSDQFFPAIADINGNGRQDMVMAAPGLSVLRLLRQTRAGTLTETVAPTMMGIRQVLSLATPDSDQDTLILLSTDEKAIGMTRMVSGESHTIPFPTIFPIDLAPNAMTVANIAGEESLIVIGKDGRDTIIRAYPTSILRDGGRAIAQADWGNPSDPFLLNLPEEIAAAIKSDNLVGVTAMDLNRNGRDDLVIFQDFRPARIFLQDEDGGFAPLTAASGILEGLLSETNVGSVLPIRFGKDDGNESAIILKDKFARAFHIDAETNNIVVDFQFNGRNARSRLTSMAIGHVRGHEWPEVALLDRGNRILTIHGYNEEEGTYDVLRHLDLGNVEYQRVVMMDIDASGKDDILLISSDRVSVHYSRPPANALDMVASASTGVEDGGFGGIYPVNLFDTDEPQIIALEMREFLLEFFELGKTKDREHAFNRFYHFKMYDQERSRATRVNLDAIPEPREVIAVDLNGDGKREILALTHDFILLYRQRD